MRWKMGLLFFALIAVVFIGCSEEEQPEPPSITTPAITQIPYDDSIKVVWQNSPEVVEEGFKGYYFYISKNSNLSGMTDTELQDYLVFDSITTDTQYIMRDYQGEGLEDGAIYYFGIQAVRSVESGDTVSGLRVVQTSPVLMGEDRIYYLLSDTICAFNFSQGVAITIDQTEPEPDFYVDTSSISETGLLLKSPHLAGTAWTGESGFKSLGIGVLDDFSETTDDNWVEEIDVSSIRIFAIKNSQNHYVKIKINNWGSDDQDRYYINFEYKYQTKTNYPYF